MNVKISRLQVCVFVPSEDNIDTDADAMSTAAAAAIYKLREKHPNIPIQLDYCPMSDPQNQLVVAQWGVSLPAMHLYAEYPDGSTSAYMLTQDLQDRFTGVNWTAEDVMTYLSALVYQSKPNEPTLLCKIFPPLCGVGKYVWLAVGAYAMWKFFTSEQKTQKLAWGAAAGFTWNEFASRGGFRDLGM